MAAKTKPKPDLKIVEELPGSFEEFRLPELASDTRDHLAAALGKAARKQDLPVDTALVAFASRSDISIGVVPVERHKEDADLLVYLSGAAIENADTPIPGAGVYRIETTDPDTPTPSSVLKTLDGRVVCDLDSSMELIDESSATARGKGASDLKGNVGVSVHAAIIVQFVRWIRHSSTQHWIVRQTLVFG